MTLISLIATKLQMLGGLKMIDRGRIIFGVVIKLAKNCNPVTESESNITPNGAGAPKTRLATMRP